MGMRISAYVSIALLALLTGCGGGGGGGGGSASPQSPPPIADTTPDAFSFAAQTGAPLASTVTSNEIIVTGISSSVPISITGGEYSIDGGAFTSAAATVSNNQRVQVRLTTSNEFSSEVTAVITIGGVAIAFTATTVDPDTTPDTFQFTRSTGATRNAWIASSSVTISGINVAVPISIDNGEYSIDGGAFTAAAGTISVGQSLALRTQASSIYSKMARARVTVGTESAEFEVISELPNYVPDRVVYDGQDIVYLLSSTHGLVFRWSLADERYLDAYVVGSTSLVPTTMTYSSVHGRLYFGYSSGAINFIDAASSSGVEVPFASTPLSVGGLAAVGNYVLAQDRSGAWATHYVFDSAGITTDQAEWNYYSVEYAWDPATSRVYFFRDHSPSDLHYEVIDQATGQISSGGETPYHGSYSIQTPIRVSADAQYILLGSGDIYNQVGLTWSGSVGSQIADARWLANGSLVTLSTASDQTTLRRLEANLANVEQSTFPGQALRVVGTDTKMAVLLIVNGTLVFHIYVPNDDSDADGVANTQDAFPLDVAASVDTDRDGYPDSWNVGHTQSDSTTGLSLDAYPQDAACYLPAHGNGVSCDYDATVPGYVPDEVINVGDTVYLLSSANRRVYRWSIQTQSYLNPYVVGIDQGFSTIAPTTMAYSSEHERLYLGYGSGAIRYIDVTSSSAAEVPFANTAMGVGGLAAVGNFVLAQDGSGAWGTHYVFDRAGVTTDQAEWNYYSREYAWDATTSRVYFFRDTMSPNDLHFEVIDQVTGQIAGEGETPYHGEYGIQPPIRLSSGGQYILLGSGNIYNQTGLTWSGSLGSQLADARWFADGSLITLSTAGNQTTLRHLSASLENMEEVTYVGQALRVVGTDASMAVLVVNNGTVAFHTYAPNNDSDGDEVLNTQDAFPLDLAASVDTDGDGYPDTWNAGRSQSDSTTGLSLDAFPQTSACFLPSHGSGGVCDYGATVPSYVPDQVVDDGDTIYLLSGANRRVYRWSITAESYLEPYVVGLSQGFSTLAPTKMAYSSAHARLYLGYSTGAVQYIDVTATSGAEAPFANTGTGVAGLGAAGNYVLVSGAWAIQYVFDSNGVITDQESSYYYSTEYAWDPVTSRVYYLRDGISPNDLNYQVIDQATGQITSAGETPYHGAYNIQHPIRVSGDGQSIVLGSGDIYNQAGLTWSRSLGTQMTDARWFASGSLVMLRTANSQTTLRRVGTNFANVEQLTYAGQALRVVGTDARMAVLLIDNGTVQFHIYVPNDDSDGDGAVNTEDAFPVDPAASVDTDRDGYPDTWNAGHDEDDSTTGLSLDAFPQDSACYLDEHGSGGFCDYGATVPNYIPDQVINEGDIVYLLSSANRRVYRWSITTESYLNPYVVGIDDGFDMLEPTTMAYSSAHGRLYLGYSSGAIQYIDVAASGEAEIPFTNTAMAVRGLAAVGNYVLAQDGSGAWATHYVFDSAGVTTDQEEWNYYSSEYAWDPVTSRIYFFSDSQSPNDLHYEVIDQATGQISAEFETPYHGDYRIQAPIRVSVGGQDLLLGSGDIYNQSDLTWAGSLGSEIVDARWFADGSLVTLSTASNQTALRRLGANFVNMEQLTYTGQAVRIVGSDALMVLLVIDNGTVQFHRYVPNDDSDSDGVLNTEDAFPLDPAASMDTDSDGYPNAWNAGSDEDDSNSGLSLDAYPNDSACYLPAHGDGVNCDYSATIPSYIPDRVLNDGDTVYLLSSENRRVYRWSIATGEYLNPYVVGIDQGFGTIAPTMMAYSSAHERLYLGYDSGAIQYLDVGSDNGIEVPFANTAMSVQGLAAVGDYVLAQDGSGAWATHYIFDLNGSVTDQEDWNYHSPEYAWDPVTSRVYFFRDHSPSDLHYEVIDQATGQISGEGETPYHGGYNWLAPIRVAPDGQHVLLGGGDFFNQSGLTWSASLGKSIKDAHWQDSVLVDVDTTDRVEIRDANTRAVLASYQYLGQPLRVLFGQTEAYLVHVMNNTTAFVRLPFYDQDADSMPRWWEELYALSDANAADATGDLDGDGVSNSDEYLNNSNPIVVDTDADGLTDFQEIVTHATDPARADSDGDGLSDEDEVLTYQSDPWDNDTDGDGYLDLDEVLYGGDPTDPSGLPQPLTSYSESFEGNPNLAAWSTPQQSNAGWAVDPATAYSGSASFRSGAIGNSQISSARFRGFFSAGQLSFYARVDAETCCDRLYLYVDGALALSTLATSQWVRLSTPLTLGIHDIEWRYEKDWSNGQAADAAWIDDVTFVAQ